jgi:hypothetical protein
MNQMSGVDVAYTWHSDGRGGIDIRHFVVVAFRRM